MIAHAEHFLSLGAQDSLAVGSDFDGADLPQGIRGIGGIHAVFERFLQLGYSETLLNKIFTQMHRNSSFLFDITVVLL